MLNRKITALLISVILTGNISAQTISTGKRYLYYERYGSAKDVFNKIMVTDPGNIDAIYWLGQTYIGEGDSTSAKILYYKTLSANPNAHLIQVGIGQIALMENNLNAARYRFEVASGRTKEKDYNVLHAIARANVDAKAGSPTYAIEIIKLIPEINRTAEIWATLGDAYRKITDGTNAQLAYENALTAEPAYAKASFMIGRIYQTQGFNQQAVYLRYYNKAIAQDPKYAPVYYWLYNYYYERDVNKSREYLDKYIAVADADAKSCYYQASILYASRLFKEAINKSNECIAAGGQEPYLKLYGLKAFAYEKLGDSANAKTFFDLYFQKQNPENLLAGDYATYGRVLLKFPGNEAIAADYFEKAIATDTVEEKKIEYITSIATNYALAKNYNEAAKWYTRIFSVKKNVTKTDLFNTAINYYRGTNYKTADSLITVYKQKYPDDMLGYYYSLIVYSNTDPAGALADCQKIIDLAAASTDSAKTKPLLTLAYNYLINYHYNVKKDIGMAIAYNDKILSIDPTNAQAIANDKALKLVLGKNVQKEKIAEVKTKSNGGPRLNSPREN